ncbi:hypothetical protein FRC07_007340, partial [Ceratobasidium sp. 392]
MSQALKQQQLQFGVLALRQSKYRKAIRHFSLSIAQDSTNAFVFDLRAAAYQRLSKLEEALSDARTCISLWPDRRIGYCRSARILLSMSQYKSCLEMLAEARQLTDPFDVFYARKTKEMDTIEADALGGFQSVEIRRRLHVDPLKKLPMEILTQICETAVDVSDVEAGPRGASHFAITLGSVC